MNDQKVALVTGGGSGIGAACAHLLARRGWQVMIIGRTESKLQSITSSHDQIHYLIGDVTDPQSVDSFVYRTWGQLGRIDVLIHAAGIFLDDSPVTELTRHQWLEFMDQANGTFFLHQLVARIMLQQRSGLSVTISSLAGIWQYMLANRSAYNVANSAKIALAVSLDMELKLHDCRSIAACFGLVETPMVETFLVHHPEFLGQSLSAAEAAGLIYQIIEQPPACPVVTITKQGGIRQATDLVWQPAPSIE